MMADIQKVLKIDVYDGMPSEKDEALFFTTLMSWFAEDSLENPETFYLPARAVVVKRFSKDLKGARGVKKFLKQLLHFGDCNGWMTSYYVLNW